MSDADTEAGCTPWCRAGEGVPSVTAGLIAVAVPGMEMSR